MIKNKDGTPFQLKKPNPMMHDQDIWGDDVKIYNMTHEEIVYRPSSMKIKKVQKEVLNPEIETTNRPQEVEFIHVEVEGVDKNEFTPLNRMKLVCHVLPTEIKTEIDPLFGEKTTKMIYSNKFTMEISFIETNDLFVTLWTNSIKSINKGSIIYIPEDRRWWKVKNTKSENDGITIECIASDITPSFG